MSYLIIAIVVCAILHFVFEAIVAPSLRLDLRYRLFALRDELRSLKIEHTEQLDRKHFEYLHESINVTIAFLNRFDIATITKINQLVEHDAELRQRVEARSKILDDCGLKSVKEIRRKTVRIAGAAFLTNSGAWGLYLLPVAVIAACFSAAKHLARQQVKTLTALPEAELERRFPSLEDTVGAPI